MGIHGLVNTKKEPYQNQFTTIFVYSRKWGQISEDLKISSQTRTSLLTVRTSTNGRAVLCKRNLLTSKVSMRRLDLFGKVIIISCSDIRYIDSKGYF